MDHVSSLRSVMKPPVEASLKTHLGGLSTAWLCPRRWLTSGQGLEDHYHCNGLWTKIKYVDRVRFSGYEALCCPWIPLRGRHWQRT